MPVIRIFYLFEWTLSSRACQKIHKNRFSVNCLLAFTGRSDRYLKKLFLLKFYLGLMIIFIIIILLQCVKIRRMGN